MFSHFHLLSKRRNKPRHLFLLSLFEGNSLCSSSSSLECRSRVFVVVRMVHCVVRITTIVMTNNYRVNSKILLFLVFLNEVSASIPTSFNVECPMSVVQQLRPVVELMDRPTKPTRAVLFPTSVLLFSSLSLVASLCFRLNAVKMVVIVVLKEQCVIFDREDVYPEFNSLFFQTFD